MSNDTPTDLELLEMAREVLNVCSTQSLKDVIEDLAITKSSVETIHRILDGQFLQPIDEDQASADWPPLMAPQESPPQRSISPPLLQPKEEIDIVLLSSDDDTNDPIEPEPAWSRSDRASVASSSTLQSTRQDSATSRQGGVLNDRKYSSSSLSKTPLSLHAKAEVPLASQSRKLSTASDYSTTYSRVTTRPSLPPDSQDPYADWDYELVQTETHGRGSPVVACSPSSRLSRTPSSTSLPRNGLANQRHVSPLGSPTADDLLPRPTGAFAKSFLRSPTKIPKDLALSRTFDPSLSDRDKGKSKTPGSETSFDLGYRNKSKELETISTTAGRSNGETKKDPWPDTFRPTKSNARSPQFEDISLSRDNDWPKKIWKQEDSGFSDYQPMILDVDEDLMKFESVTLPASKATVPSAEASLESIADIPLSPPKFFTDDFDDNSEDELLMDDVFSSNTKNRRRKGAGSTTASRQKNSDAPGTKRTFTSTRNNKRLSSSTEDALREWGMEGILDEDDQGPQSLENEILQRAKARKKMKAKAAVSGTDENSGGDDVSNEDSDYGEAGSNSKSVKAAQRKAEREAQKQAREAEKAVKKAAREEELQRKRALKEQERMVKEQEKLAKEQDKIALEVGKKAEKTAARALIVVNRLAHRTEAAKDMIICIEETLHESTFGQILDEYLVPLGCGVKYMQSGTQKRGMTQPCPLPNMIFWQRRATSRYDRDQDLFIPIEEGDRVTELESLFVWCLDVDEFSKMLDTDTFRPNLEKVKRDMRLRKNTERMNNAGKIKPSSSSLTMPPERLLQDKQRQKLRRMRLILLVKGFDSYTRELKKTTSKKFQEAVRATIQGGSENTNPEANQRADWWPSSERGAVDQDRVEKELLWLQMEEDCHVIHSNDDDESAEALVNFTEQIGLLPFKDARRSNLNAYVEGIRSGADETDTWVKSLQEIFMVTMLVAKSIVEEYPTLKSLYEGYRVCRSVYEAEFMLADIPIIGRNNSVGRAISSRIYRIFMSEDAGTAVL